MNWHDIQWQYIFNPELAIESFPFVLSGIGYTLIISGLAFLFGMMNGLILARFKASSFKVLRVIAQLYISFFRGVPALVVLFLLYFGLPFIGVLLEPLVAAVIGFTLTSSAYTAEIWRSAINAVDKDQWDAGHALALSDRKIFRRIIFPQAVRVAIPPMSNVLLDLVKGSSLTAMITVPEIFQNAKIIGGRENDYMTMYIMVALIYWVICSVYAYLQIHLEAKYRFGEEKVETSSSITM